MKKEKLKDGLLIDVLNRLIEVSGKATTKHRIVIPQDPTSATHISVYAYLPDGIGEEQRITDCSDVCMVNNFGNYDPNYDEACEFCKKHASDIATECKKLNDNCGQWLIPVGPQLIEIDIDCIYGQDITINNFNNGSLLMHCYFDDGVWHERKSPNDPQDALLNIVWNAEFIDAEEAKEMKENWTDADWWELRSGYDPFGCPSDYE